MTYWTEKQTRTLMEMYPTNPGRIIAPIIGKSIKSIKTKATVLKLHKAPGYNRAAHSERAITEDEIKFIQENYLKYTNHDLANIMYRSESAIQSCRKKLGIEGKVNTGCYTKGTISLNKGKKRPPGWSTPAMKRTQFKKGSLPHNTKTDDEITIRTYNKRGTKYYYKRIAQAKWGELHRLIWQEHHGKIPKGFNVQFKDGNTLNCVIENLYLITRDKQMVQNSIQRFPPEVKGAIRLVSKLKRKIKKYEQQD